ncbi:hypothetical protein F4804DRAFT_303843 [Jackrogersella minutella]|nr:hypothetical protein F4804DRAFT_303843 [Jackrogersella minutella]
MPRHACLSSSHIRTYCIHGGIRTLPTTLLAYLGSSAGEIYPSRFFSYLRCCRVASKVLCDGGREHHRRCHGVVVCVPIMLLAGWGNLAIGRLAHILSLLSADEIEMAIYHNRISCANVANAANTETRIGEYDSHRTLSGRVFNRQVVAWACSLH